MVLDSSAKYEGVLLNKELLLGPDLMNSLLGDIEQMLHSLHVNPGHRDFLRFLWYEDNTPSKWIMEYWQKLIRGWNV